MISWNILQTTFWNKAQKVLHVYQSIQHSFTHNVHVLQNVISFRTTPKIMEVKYTQFNVQAVNLQKHRWPNMACIIMINYHGRPPCIGVKSVLLHYALHHALKYFTLQQITEKHYSNTDSKSWINSYLLSFSNDVL